MSYIKLFGSIIHSTIWQAPGYVRLVWISLMAMADRDGIVEASIPGLAKVAGTTLAETESALADMMAPDPYSRTPDHEGRRLAVVDGGWRLLNHDKYRDKLDLEDRRAKTAARVARHREKKHRDSVTQSNASNDLKHEIRHAEAATDPASDPDLRSSPDQGSLFSASSEPSGDHDHDRARGKKPAAHTPVLERFHTLYFGAYGVKPTWGAKQVEILKRLVAGHSASEVIRRMEILFTSAPSWLRPPFDVGTLSQHFDKLAAAVVERADPRRGMTPAEIIAWGEDEGRKHEAG